MSIEKSIVIAQKGMSFEIIARTRLFPTLEILNSFWLCGIDDAASEIVIQWKPFKQNEYEYDSFFQFCQKIIGSLEINDLQTDRYSDWFRKAAVQT